MKKVYWLLESIFIIILILAINNSNTVYAATTNATLTDDAYVWFSTDDASKADTVYNTSEFIVRTAPKNICEIYLKFDLSNISAPINNARLSLYGENIPVADTVQINVFDADDNSWSENSITYNNRPITGETEIASTRVSSADTGTRVYFDLTDYITQNISSIKEEKKGILTLVLKDKTAAIIKFASKESDTEEKAPKLEIESSSALQDDVGISSEITVGMKFKDLQGHWAEEDINYMVNKSIINGVDEYSFAPERNITRAEFTAIIVRILGLDMKKNTGSLSDVDPGKWYADSIETAIQAAIIDTEMIKDNTFKPEQPITREEMTSLIIRAYSKITGIVDFEGDLSSFTDRNTINNWAVGYVKMAYKMGIIKGVGEDTFAPKESATRAQATVIAKRLYSLLFNND